MYQNATFIPLTNTRGDVEHICIIIYDVTDVAVNKKELEQLNKKLEQVSQTDSLTQLANRGHWEHTLRQEFLRTKRSGGCSTLLMFDIDHFKKVNDEYGHSCGDEALRHIAKLLKGTLRETDIAGSNGGEEFAIILPCTDIEGALLVAEQIRQAISELTIVHNGHTIPLTVSIGVSETIIESDEHPMLLLEQADKALYKAKRSGRNKVCYYPLETDEI